MRRTWINKKKIAVFISDVAEKERVNQCTWEEGDDLTQIHNRVVGFCETPPILRNTDCLAALSHAWKKMGLSLKKPKMSWRPKKVKRNQLPLAPSASLAFRLLGYCSLAIAVLATRYSADAFSHGVLSIFGLVCDDNDRRRSFWQFVFSRADNVAPFLTFENTAAVIPTLSSSSSSSSCHSEFFFEILFLCHWLWAHCSNPSSSIQH